jgi:hypothetical protein
MRGLTGKWVRSFLAAMLLVCFVSSSASAAEDHPCKGLKPFSNLEELLYQFYINDNECLFTMPVNELEKIWDIKILSEERRKPKNYYPLSEIEFYNKPYKSERDAFYIEMDTNKKAGQEFFLILITRAYYEKHGTLFPDGSFPDFISKFLISRGSRRISYFWVFPKSKTYGYFIDQPGITEIILLNGITIN